MYGHRIIYGTASWEIGHVIVALILFFMDTFGSEIVRSSTSLLISSLILWPILVMWQWFTQRDWDVLYVDTWLLVSIVVNSCHQQKYPVTYCFKSLFLATLLHLSAGDPRIDIIPHRYCRPFWISLLILSILQLVLPLACVFCVLLEAALLQHHSRVPCDNLVSSIFNDTARISLVVLLTHQILC